MAGIRAGAGSGIRFRVSVVGEQRLLARVSAPKFRERLIVWGQDTLNIVRNAINITIPNGPTGRLKSQVSYDLKVTKRNYTLEVTPRAPYAAAVEKGSRPHIITAVSASVMAWRTSGVTVFMHAKRGGVRRRQSRLPTRRGPVGQASLSYARRVSHPGFSGRHYFKTALDKARPRIRQSLRETIQVLTKPGSKIG